MNTVLVVDDKEMLRDSVGATLQRAGFNIVTAESAPAALEAIARRRPDCVVTDFKMPGMTGIELLEQARQIDDTLPFIVMTAFGSVDTAVQAIKKGAFDYLTKPFEGDELVISVKRAMEHARVLRENAVLKSSAENESVATASAGPLGLTGMDRLVGDSPAMRRVKQQVLAVAESAGTVMICGESGTGKEVVARAIHDMSPRAGAPLLAVNCAALSESLLESELFGHERGSFTGAEKLRKGRFELADRGTLVLDEISEVSPRVQAKLLRVLQERAFERVGSSMTIGVDVRVVATSNRDLPRAVARGDFRQDLFFRLNVLPIHLPALRDRLEDVPALVEHFTALVSKRDGRPAKRFDDAAITLLKSYPWPGNVRELQNIIERAVVLCKGEVVERALIEPWLLTAEAVEQIASGRGGMSMIVGQNGHNGHARPSSNAHVPQASFTTSTPVVPTYDSSIEAKPSLGSSIDAVTGEAIQIAGRQLEDIERDAIIRTLNKFNGHRQRTAHALGIGVRTLGLKLKKWKELQLVDAQL